MIWARCWNCDSPWLKPVDRSWYDTVICLRCGEEQGDDVSNTVLRTSTWVQALFWAIVIGTVAALLLYLWFIGHPAN